MSKNATHLPPQKLCGAYPTALEPSSLVDVFMRHPPAGFVVRWLESQALSVPIFSTKFDLLTTLDEDRNTVTKFLRESHFLEAFFQFPTLFVGTTVSEYALIPDVSNFSSLIESLKTPSSDQLVIFKDIPCRSPLLSEKANLDAADLLNQLGQSGFLIVEGQALAYVPIDFADTDDYLSRVSYTRRKDLRRKLKKLSLLQIESLPTGRNFASDSLVDELYQLYLNVYDQSRYHFDKLSLEFFAETLRDSANGGIVFLYKRDGLLIGFNQCFIVNEMLIDKYIGLKYPDARETNLYFVSWFTNLEYALQNKLTHYVAGWTDPEVKQSLGARFTFTKHAVFVRNPILRVVLKRFQKFFEPDNNWAEQVQPS